ncbi:tail fiber protein [Acetobacteraceae bacterium]|nr:tail fiber protein [Acetobacteraceae bacterium]
MPPSLNLSQSEPSAGAILPLLILGNGAPDESASDLSAAPAGSVYLDSTNLPSNDKIPALSILSYYDDTPPNGWFLLDGGAFEKDKYPVLAQKFPNGSLPDFRNRVARGAGNLISLGEVQEDAIQNITGTMTGIYCQLNNTGTGCFSQIKSGTGWIDLPYGNNGADTDTPPFKFDASGSVQTADETRVKSVGVNFIINAA